MKIQRVNNVIISNSNYLNLGNHHNTKAFQEPSFNAALPKSSSITEKILKNKLVKGLFGLADKNPFAFNIVALAVSCMAFRPATIMIVPGSNDKDKKYAAGKSIIASSVATVSRLLFILPLGIAIKKLGENAKKDPKINFPHGGTAKFNTFNFAVNNATGALIAIPTAALVVYLVAKIMDKIVPKDKKGNNSPDVINKQILPASEKIENSQEGKAHGN